MKAVVQRVINADVSVEQIEKGRVDSGLLVYLGVGLDDSEKDADWLAEKISGLRIFNDSEGKMNLSLYDLVTNNKQNETIGVLVISQFTLFADTKKGKRPSWNGAAPPEKAKQLYEYFINAIKKQGLFCANGEFQAHMKVTYTNDGPVTVIIDTKEK
ncbi:MAG: D-aminoacyl-tRNA deacylase [Treponema sp.]|nr:D-aminoacyl-tRNA deacylase [Treponema sp.]